jgi:hypothetical protein
MFAEAVANEVAFGADGAKGVAGEEVEARLVPMNTTSTAVYAAVAAKTSLPVLSLAPKASISANSTVAIDVVPRLKFRSPCFAIMIVGAISAIPPNKAMVRRDIKAVFSATFLGLARGSGVPKWITVEFA